MFNNSRQETQATRAVVGRGATKQPVSSVASFFALNPEILSEDDYFRFESDVGWMHLP